MYLYFSQFRSPIGIVTHGEIRRISKSDLSWIETPYYLISQFVFQ